MLRSLIVAAFLIVGNLAYGMCQDFPPPAVGRFCIHSAAESTNADVVYYFHGHELSETAWEDPGYYPRQIKDYWAAKGLQQPTVIVISFGPLWLLTSPNSSEASGLFEAVAYQAIPQIENMMGGVRGRRIILGESMGSFNAIQLSLRTQLFDKAALLCAPMMDGVTPFSTPEEIDRYVLASTAYAYDETAKAVLDEHVGKLVFLSRAFFPTAEEYAVSDPMVLAQAATPSASFDTQFYIAAGFYDPYVLFEGNQKFAQILTERGFNVDWRPQWGTHCAIDIPTLAEFLVR